MRRGVWRGGRASTWSRSTIILHVVNSLTIRAASIARSWLVQRYVSLGFPHRLHEANPSCRNTRGTESCYRHQYSPVPETCPRGQAHPNKNKTDRSLGYPMYFRNLAWIKYAVGNPTKRSTDIQCQRQLARRARVRFPCKHAGQCKQTRGCVGQREGNVTLINLNSVSTGPLGLRHT